MAHTQRYLLRQMPGPRTPAEQSFDQHLLETQAMAQQAQLRGGGGGGGAQTPSYGPPSAPAVFPSPIVGDPLLTPVGGGGLASDSETDFMNLFTDNATTHLSSVDGQYWNAQEPKSAALVSSVASPVPPTTTVANTGGLSSSGRGAVNKRSRSGATAACGEATKPAKAARVRVARPKKASLPAPVTGQYYTCDQQPPRVVNPPLAGLQY